MELNSEKKSELMNDTYLVTCVGVAGVEAIDLGHGSGTHRPDTSERWHIPVRWSV